ncbi:hypothetical protein PENSOL_c082G05414 [Penicillium solitum]|uniref:Uncharacterized protein n=1 Tax=Penicillium solitum TaxID=60172 RepID=A0A1V6QCJ3_9EURO|nr:uncharacterized protein PENSOL_c082G05414 [Penicillium solitum]OQD86925.1 hypothetical protein PENSOL_c082G05414 [Penicillium solitum]
MSFNYTDSSNALKSVPRSTDKRGTSSATQRILLQRYEDINAAKEATGQPPAWDYVYSLMRCSSRACELGPHCWRDSISKKHIKLTVQNLRGLSSNLSAPSTPTPTVAMCPGKNAPGFLEIPGLRDFAVTEYSEWQQSQVSDEKLKAEFRKARDTC